MNRKVTGAVSEEELEAAQQRSYLVGQSVGLEEAAGRLMDAGAEAFKRGRDQEANLFRHWAKVFESAAKDRHPLKTCGKCKREHYPEDQCGNK